MLRPLCLSDQMCKLRKQRCLLQSSVFSLCCFETHPALLCLFTHNTWHTSWQKDTPVFSVGGTCWVLGGGRVTKENEIPTCSQVGGNEELTPEQPNEMIFSGDHFWRESCRIPKYTSKPFSSLENCHWYHFIPANTISQLISLSLLPPSSPSTTAGLGKSFWKHKSIVDIPLLQSSP